MTRLIPSRIEPSGTDYQLLTTISGLVVWDNPVNIVGIVSHPFSYNGELEVTTGTHRLYFPEERTISHVLASVGVAPTGADIIVDIHMNGTTIFSTQANRPTIAASAFVDASAIPNTLVIPAGNYLTVDIDQVGSTVIGSDLTVQVFTN
jgi:hypothetical protein